MNAMPSLGDDVGPYRLVRELGRGGMGIVYAARDLRLDREVALKLITPQWAGEADFRARFQREALALSRMDSPHVVQVYDSGEADGCLYLVTQLVPDGDLLQHLARRGALPPAVALDLVVQLLDGLTDAHRAGVVHRDVKPSNVLLRARGEHLEAVLCDFGIASTADAQITRTGALVGSYPYMAPERHQGEPASASGDVYAAGCVLWQALTGTAPYAGTDMEVALAHLQAPLPQLPAGGAFVKALNAVLRRALAKLPQERYPTARAMRGDLAAALTLAPASVALPDVTQVRHSVLPGVLTAAGAQRRRRRAAALGAVASVAAVAVAVVAVVAVNAGGPDPVLAGGTPPVTVTGPGGVVTVTDPSDPSGPVTLDGGTLSPSERARRARSGGSGSGSGDGPEGGSGSGDPVAPLPGSTGPAPVGGAGGGAGGGGSGGGSGSGGGGGGSSEPTTRPTRAPAPAPSSTPTRSTPTYRCWDGEGTQGPRQCSNPTGAAGVDYLYHDPAPCQRAAQAAPRVITYTCRRMTPHGRGQVVYTEWRGPRAARAALRSEYGEAARAWRGDWGVFWSEKTPKQRLVSSRTNLYGTQSFSVRFAGTTPKATQWLLQSIRYRLPSNLKGNEI